MTERASVALPNRNGLHARPAHLFVQTANEFQAEIRVRREGDAGDPVDGKSIMSMMMLAAEHGAVLEIEAEGDDEAAAVTALRDLVASGFGEE
ncbi:MAG: HPr family phosphocarrier protein [Planctomycetota bacterium]